MKEQPRDSAEQGSGSPPKFFSTMNGMIAGATGLIVALGGLLTAYTQFFDKDKTETATPAQANTAAPVAAAAIPSESEADAPLVYEGDDARMEWTDDRWVLKTAEGRWEYADEYSKYEGYVLAYDKTNQAYMRWPIKGGMAEQRKDGEGWGDWINLYPAEPEQEEAVAG